MVSRPRLDTDIELRLKPTEGRSPTPEATGAVRSSQFGVVAAVVAAVDAVAVIVAAEEMAQPGAAVK